MASLFIVLFQHFLVILDVVETHVVLLESMVAFLLENDKKFSLLSIDGKVRLVLTKTSKKCRDELLVCHAF